MAAPVDICAGSDLGLTEAPHIFKRNGWYYLTTAEGGTGYDHAVTLARARDILGPYETHPDKHVMTARFAPGAALQRVGHGPYVDTPEGRVFHTFLCGRPLPGRFCTLERESGLVVSGGWRAGAAAKSGMSGRAAGGCGGGLPV